MAFIKVFKISIILIIFLLGNSPIINAQNRFKPDCRILEIKDSLYLYLDNSDNYWYSFELAADTVYPLERFIILDNKPLQVNSVWFKMKKAEGVEDDVLAEEMALKQHKKWELKYQKKTFRQRLNSEEQVFKNEFGKPFLIWWHNVPEIKKKGSISERVIPDDISDNNETGNQNSPDSGILYNVSHMMYLSFIINYTQVVALSIPVYENENIDHSVEFLKKIAESVKSFGGKIDIYYLKKKIQLPDDYKLSDYRNLLKIKLPDYLTVLDIPYKQSFMFAFPEMGQVINVALIKWEYTDSTDNLNIFVDKSYSNGTRDNLRNLENESNHKEYQYTSDNGRFIYHDVFVKGKKITYRVLFTATNTTYTRNLSRFMNFIKGIEIEPYNDSSN